VRDIPFGESPFEASHEYWILLCGRDGRKILTFFENLTFRDVCINKGTINLGVVEMSFGNLTLLSPLSSMLAVWFTFNWLFQETKKGEGKVGCEN